jgi:hypothetical protein
MKAFKGAKTLRLIGYFLLGFSFIFLAIVALLPFVIQDLSMIVSINIVLLIASESMFALSIFILGKEFWIKIKLFFRKIISKLVKLRDDKR